MAEWTSVTSFRAHSASETGDKKKNLFQHNDHLNGENFLFISSRQCVHVHMFTRVIDWLFFCMYTQQKILCEPTHFQLNLFFVLFASIFKPGAVFRHNHVRMAKIKRQAEVRFLCSLTAAAAVRQSGEENFLLSWSRERKWKVYNLFFSRLLVLITEIDIFKLFKMLAFNFHSFISRMLSSPFFARTVCCRFFHISTFRSSSLNTQHNTAPKQMSRTVREIYECVFNDRGTTWKMITISMENPPTNQNQEPECLAWAAKVQKAIFHPHIKPSQAPPLKSFTANSIQRFPLSDPQQWLKWESISLSWLSNELDVWWHLLCWDFIEEHFIHHQCDSNSLYVIEKRNQEHFDSQNIKLGTFYFCVKVDGHYLLYSNTKCEKTIQTQ